MTQAASLAPPVQAPRLSQLLPTVTCSSCSQPVPLADLTGHVCPPPPPSLQKPPASPKAANSFLSQRLQNLVSGTTIPPRKSSLEREPPASAPLRSASQLDPFQRLPASVSIPRKASHPTLPISVPLRTTSPASISSTNTRTSLAQSAPEDSASTLGRKATPSFLRARTPSSSNSESKHSPGGSNTPGSADDHGRHFTAGRSRAASLVKRENLSPPLQPPVPILIPRTNTPSNASLPPSLQPHMSTERTQTPPTASSLPRPSMVRHHPSGASSDSQRPPPDRKVTFLTPQPNTSFNPRRPKESSTIPFPSLPPPQFPGAPIAQSSPSPISLPRSPVPESERDIDTKCGGEAGMAGVGRRGFAAAARAAMLATSLSNGYHHAMISPEDGRLDISAAMLHIMHASVTPPLSPNSGYTPSPVSPFPSSPISFSGHSTSTSVQYVSVPSAPNALPDEREADSANQKIRALSSPTDVHIGLPSHTPPPSPPIPNPFERRLSGETVTQSPMYGSNMRLPLLDMLKQSDAQANESDDESVYTMHTSDIKGDKGPLSPSGGSEVGLAYADDSDGDTPVVLPLHLRKSQVNMAKVKFPTVPSPDRNSRPVRKQSAASTSSSVSSHSTTVGKLHRSTSSATQTTTKSGGALERAMETLIEEGASISVLASGSVLASIAGPSTSRGASGKPNRSNTVPGPASPENKTPKLPTRSHTNPSHPLVHSERVKAAGEVARIRNGCPKNDRICARCDAKLQDGRWIQMDGGGVLCERCWKNMYLPKCRRCNLPIEKQAVSSRDGQLKGKYHKDCFNCHTCHKPFPDKEFYVFDGKPFCAYHYHEANDSLCAATSCGQPIEGPCAVNHAGRRYHPEHLLCEYEDGCVERLVEYWEVDGQMLCERHAGVSCGRDDSSVREDEDVGTVEQRKDEGRARKRMTRFIDLGPGDDGEVDIR